MRMVWVRIVALAAMLVGSGAWAAPEAGTMTIVYSGNTDGELEPCGCTVQGNLGGFLRRATVVDGLREQAPDLYLVSSGGLVISWAPQDRLTGQYILQGMAHLGYDAVGVQWADLAYGEGFLLDGGPLSWVSSNWRGEGFLPVKTVKRDGHALAFFSWLDPAASPHKAMNAGGEDVVHGDTQLLARALRSARADGALTMLATTLPLAEAQRQLPLADVDILVIESAYEVYGAPRQVGAMLVLQPGSRGMRIGRLTVTRDDAGRIQSFDHEVIPMPETVADAPRLEAWYAEYNAQVKANYLERVALRKATDAGESPFVGEAVCQSCHGPIHEQWSETEHSGAFAKLEAVNKAFDPKCIGCHTVGFDQEGGFIDMDATPELINVQCENCHGAGRAHVDSAGAKPPAHGDWSPQQMCAQCHVHEHSPTFVFDQYWPRIRHGAGTATVGPGEGVSNSSLDKLAPPLQSRAHD